MLKYTSTLATAVCVGLVIACGSDKSTGPSNITYKATLTAANEVNPNGSSAGVVSSGQATWTGTLDPTTNVLTWTMTYSGLGTTSIASHIHAQGPTTTTASVVLNFATFAGSTLTLNATSGSANGSINLATATPTTGLTITGDSLRRAMDAGQAYVNIHSTQYPAGEIRGQIVKQ